MPSYGSRSQTRRYRDRQEMRRRFPAPRSGAGTHDASYSHPKAGEPACSDELLSVPYPHRSAWSHFTARPAAIVRILADSAALDGTHAGLCGQMPWSRLRSGTSSRTSSEFYMLRSLTRAGLFSYFMWFHKTN